MAAPSPDVKRPPPRSCGKCGWLVYRRDRCVAWIDKHPRLGWYLFALNFLNVVLNVLDLLH
jgi:hypothetical protein